MQHRHLVHTVPDAPQLWSSEHERLFYFETIAATAAEAVGEEFADLIDVQHGHPGHTATIVYRVLTPSAHPEATTLPAPH
ncbi:MULTISPECIES: hypothetical protein [Nocardiaceae]|uniref:Uncharacterized protein n=1 Tax=Williamsia limnetica TaxID=882452 RepID=A0A318RF86_WILLI|nr:hypothetical protein [Williamsia limnetica]PYE11122.1 hypothetical protein DFR67_1406 [Williamsia limnetica]